MTATKIIMKLASIAGGAGTTELSVKDIWHGVRKYILFANITEIGGSPTNVQISLTEKVSGDVKLASGTITATSAGAAKTSLIDSIGVDAEITVVFSGGSSPSVTADVYIIAYEQ